MSRRGAVAPVQLPRRCWRVAPKTHRSQSGRSAKWPRWTRAAKDPPWLLIGEASINKWAMASMAMLVITRGYAYLYISIHIYTYLIISNHIYTYLYICRRSIYKSCIHDFIVASKFFCLSSGQTNYNRQRASSALCWSSGWMWTLFQIWGALSKVSKVSDCTGPLFQATPGNLPLPLGTKVESFMVQSPKTLAVSMNL